MRVALLEHFGSPSALRVQKRPDLGVPGPGRLLVEVEAAGVCIDDVLLRMGLESEAPALPLTPGLEVCGKVLAIGDGVRGVVAGERICGLTNGGGYAEQCHLEAAMSFKVGGELEPSRVVALPYDYCTAWFCVHRLLRLQAPESLLVIGADAGPGRAAVELAARAGLVVYAIGSERDELVGLGAREVVTLAGAAEALRELTAGQGLDAILDTDCGERHAALTGLLAPLGRVVQTGFHCLLDRHRSFLRALYKVATMPQHSGLTLAAQCRVLGGFSLRGLWQRPDLIQQAFNQLDLTALQLKVDRVYPLEEVAAAHGRFQDGAHRGKIVLEPRRA